MAQVFVPFGIYLTTYFLLNQGKKITRLAISLGALLLYLLFLRSGQDIHFIIFLFTICYTWSKLKPNKIISLLSGILLGLIGFFRIESGIITLISIITAELFFLKKEKKDYSLYLSYLLFQIFYFLFIALNGSLPNFFHDVIQMGVLAQPKIMKVFIQPTDFPLFEFFLLLNIFTFFIAVLKKNKPFIFLSSVSLLSFTSALGRADFEHLFYSIVLLIPAIVIAFSYFLPELKTILSQKLSHKTIILAILLVTFAILTIKKQSSFLMISFIPLLIISVKILKKQIGILSVLLIIIIFHTLIRSQSLFTFYAKKQFYLPNFKTSIKEYNQIFLFPSEIKKGNYGGYQLDAANAKILEQIKLDLNGKTFFIYPSHVTLYHALNQKTPIRYIYFNNEYTPKMEEETVKMLQDQKIEYIIMSYELTKSNAVIPNQTKQIQKYINDNYTKLKEYPFGNDNMILMKKSKRV